MIDGGVIAGYLALAVARGVDRFVNGRIDSILNSLANRVARKMGLGPATDLKPDPTDARVQHKIARAVETRSQSDPQFRRDLSVIQAQLDREGGRALLQQLWNNSVNQAYGGNVVQAHRVSGDVAGRDVHKHTYHAHSAEDYSQAPAWVKIMIWVGVLISLTGFAILVATGIEFVANLPDQEAPGPPNVRNLAVGGGMFFAGIIISGIGSLGHATTRRKE